VYNMNGPALPIVYKSTHNHIHKTPWNFFSTLCSCMIPNPSQDAAMTGLSCYLALVLGGRPEKLEVEPATSSNGAAIRDLLFSAEPRARVRTDVFCFCKSLADVAFWYTRCYPNTAARFLRPLRLEVIRAATNCVKFRWVGLPDWFAGPLAVLRHSANDSVGATWQHLTLTDPACATCVASTLKSIVTR